LKNGARVLHIVLTAHPRMAGTVSDTRVLIMPNSLRIHGDGKIFIYHP